MAIIKGIFDVLMGALMLAFTLRAVLSWFQDGSGDCISSAYEVAFAFTEPLILPVRIILDRLRIGGGSPMDIAFMITLLLIMTIDFIL